MTRSIGRQILTMVLVYAGISAVAGGILWIANLRMNEEIRQGFQADRIQKGVFELALTTRGYLAYGEDAAKDQWEARFSSLRSLVEGSVAHSEAEQQRLRSIGEHTVRIEQIFHEMVRATERRKLAAREEADILRAVTERLASWLVGESQALAGEAVLFTQISNDELARVKRLSSLLVLASVLAAVGLSVLVSIGLARDIRGDLRQLQLGAETVTAGNLQHRVRGSRTEEIGRLAAAFNEMTGRLEATEVERRAVLDRLVRSNRELDSFAAIASHDLQEPLRKIRSFGDLLEARSGRMLDAEGRDCVRRMQNAAERMQQLIEGLLAFSRVSMKPEPMAVTDLGLLVREVLVDLSVRITEAGAVVEVGELPSLVASPLQMRQLFQNLLGNSLKFRGDRRPEIRVAARRFRDAGRRLADPGGPWVEIRVEDNGIGFDAQHLDRLFLPFSRLHGRGDFEGTGMGLAICRKIVERHQGTITATATPGGGATFVAVLPLDPAQGGAGPVPHGQGEP